MPRWKLFAAAGALALVAAAAIVYAPHAYGQTPSPAPAPAPRAERAPYIYRDMFSAGSQIGVTVRDLDKATAGASSGTLVEEVRANSPAERAGVKQSDVITDFDGERVRSARQFSRLVEETPEGRPVKITVLRNGQRITLDVTTEARRSGRVMPIAPRIPEMRDLPNFELELRPKMQALERELRDLPQINVFTNFGNGRLGVQVQDLNDQLAEYFGVKRGALVMSVSKDSAAAKAGLKAGDVITSVNGTAVEDASDVRRALGRVDEGKEFPVEVMRDHKALSLKGKLEPPAHERPGTRTEVF